MSDQRTQDNTPNETHMVKRKRILDIIQARGVKVPQPKGWKLSQLHMLDAVLVQLDRKHQAQIAAVRRELDALHAQDFQPYEGANP